ncbi:MAG: methionine--tRNA ligase subunit beta [Bdellovibrionota bacterium]
MDEAKPSTDSTSPAAAPSAAPAAKPAEVPPADNLITIDYFSKVQLRVAQIVAAERVEGSEKLVKLKVDVGEPAGPRQILAGIAKHYVPDDLIGRKIVIVANLKPAKLMGQLSEGMLLAASDAAGNLELLSPGSVVAPGSVVR